MMPRVRSATSCIGSEVAHWIRMMGVYDRHWLETALARNCEDLSTQPWTDRYPW